MALEFREVREEDLDATLAAYERASRARRVPGSDVSRAEWRWLFAANPAGRRAFAAFDEGGVRAHFALLPHRVWAGGKERVFGEVARSFEVEGGRGLYALTAKALDAAREAGATETVAYAWPGAAEGRVLERLLGFETVRTDPWLLAATEDATERPPGVETVERFGEDARWLWDRCSGAFAASTIRDAAFLNWRFLDRPRTREGAADRRPRTREGAADRRPGEGEAARYLALGVRAEGVLRGYAVVAPSRTPETWHLVDFLCPPEEPEVGEALVAAARNAARSAGAVALGALLVPWSPWFERFQRLGFQVHGRGRFLLARSVVRKLDDLWLREGWWYTLADSVVDDVVGDALA